MRYQSIILELLKQRTELHEQLRQNRTLLNTAERLALELKADHEVWIEAFSQERPGSESSQIVAEALEIVMKEMEDRLDSATPLDDQETLSLDEAMTFVRKLSPQG